METVYIETTVVSYLVSEPSRDLIIAGHQQITCDWWNHHRHNFTCLISQLVLDEASAGDTAQAAMRLAVLRDLASISITPAVIELAKEFVAHGPIPEKAARDAFHIAAAAIHRLDYLVTWNCRHIANAQMLKKLQQLCREAGHELPIVCTLEELMGDYANEL